MKTNKGLGLIVGLAALCAVCAGGVVALGFAVRSPWFMAQARGHLERGIGRKVTFSSLEPSLLRGVGVRASGFCLYEEDGETPCLKADSVFLRVRLLPLLRRTLSVSTIAVERPRASLVRARDGRWNIEDLLGAGGPPAGAPAAAAAPRKARKARVIVSALRVRGGAVTVLDESTGRGAVARDLDLTLYRLAQGSLPYIDGACRLSGVSLPDLLDGVKEIRPLRVRGGLAGGAFRIKGWAGENLHFRAEVDATGVVYDYPGVFRSTGKGIDIDLKAEGDGAVAGKGFRLARIDARCFGGRLTVRGVPGGGAGTDMVFAGKALPWRALGEPAAPGLVLDGESTFSGEVKGGPGRLGAGLVIDLASSRIAYGGAVEKPRGAAASLTLPLSFPGGRVAWEGACAQLGSVELRSDGFVETAGGRLLSATLRSNSFELRDLGPPFTAGRGEVDLRRAALPIGASPLPAGISGTVKVTGGEFAPPSLPHPVRVDAVAACSPGAVRVGLNTFSTGSSVAEGYVNFDLDRWPAFEVELNVPVLDTADFSAPRRARSEAAGPSGAPPGRQPPIENAPPAAGGGAAHAPAPPGVPAFLLGMEGGGGLSVGEIRAGKLNSRNGRARLRLSKGVASLEEISVPLYGGEAKGRFSAEMGRTPPAYSLSARLAGVDLDPLLSDIYGYSRSLSGRLSAECVASGAGAGWDEVRKGLAAKGRFSLDGGVLRSGGIIKGIGPIMLMLGRQAKCREFISMGELLAKAPSETAMKRCDGAFRFDGDGWGVGDMLVETDDPKFPLRLKIAGRMGLDGSLRFDGRASFPRGSACYAQLAPYFPDDGGWIELPFPIPIGGTLGNPRVDADASAEGVAKCAAGIGAARVRREIEKKIEKALAPAPAKGGGGEGRPQKIDDVGRELLKSGSKEILKQMLKQ